jgi:nitronate monooxygenase
MCGTLFIASVESSAHPLYKEKIIASSAKDTVITKIFHIGWEDRSHRVIVNPTVESKGALPAKFIAQNNINGKKYPIPRYSAALPVANTSGDILNMALYSGTGCEHVTRELSVREIFNEFASSYSEALAADAHGNDTSVHRWMV